MPKGGETASNSVKRRFACPGLTQLVVATEKDQKLVADRGRGAPKRLDGTWVAPACRHSGCGKAACALRPMNRRLAAFVARRAAWLTSTMQGSSSAGVPAGVQCSIRRPYCCTFRRSGAGGRPGAASVSVAVTQKAGVRGEPAAAGLHAGVAVRVVGLHRGDCGVELGVPAGGAP